MWLIWDTYRNTFNVFSLIFLLKLPFYVTIEGHFTNLHPGGEKTQMAFVILKTDVSTKYFVSTDYVNIMTWIGLKMHVLFSLHGTKTETVPNHASIQPSLSDLCPIGTQIHRRWISCITDMAEKNNLHQMQVRGYNIRLSLQEKAENSLWVLLCCKAKQNIW